MMPKHVVKKLEDVSSLVEQSRKGKTCPALCDDLTLLHGTSKRRAEKILAEGFKDSRELPEEMLEGYSSQYYEGGLAFFGKTNAMGRRIASRHAYRVAYEDFARDHPGKTYDTLTNDDIREINQNAAVVEVDVCACNYLRDEDVTPEAVAEVVDYAAKKAREGDKTGYRYTYHAPSPRNGAFGLVGTGVMPDKKVGMGKIMEFLGVDAIDGYEEGGSVVLNTPNKNILRKRVAEPPPDFKFPEKGGEST